MGFPEETCFTAVCDKCGERFEDDGYTAHFTTVQAASSSVEDADWLVKADGSVYCDRDGCQPTCTCDDCEKLDCPGWQECPECPRHGGARPAAVMAGQIAMPGAGTETAVAS